MQPKGVVMTTQYRERDAFPYSVCVGLPLAVLLIPHIGYVFGAQFLKNGVYSEFGIVENLTGVFLFFAVLSGLRTLMAKPFPEVRFLFAWVALFTLGCFYFMGEEISWGQTYFHWATPATWGSLNDQAETNLHNVAGIFDQVPRVLLSIGTFLGGVVIPIYLRSTRRELSSERIWYWIFPPIELLPVALFATLVAIPGKTAKALHFTLPISFTEGAGELKEALLALFLFLYLLSIARRIIRSFNDLSAYAGEL